MDVREDAQRVVVKTEEEMITQLKLLVNNGYVVGVQKIDNLLGNTYYQFIYAKGAE